MTSFMNEGNLFCLSAKQIKFRLIFLLIVIPTLDRVGNGSLAIWTPFGLKYSGYLKRGSSEFQMVKKGLVCKWSGFWTVSEIQKPDHLKSRQMAAILSKTISNLDKNVLISNGLVFKMVRSRNHLKTRPFKIQNRDHRYRYSHSPTLWKPEHLKFDI